MTNTDSPAPKSVEEFRRCELRALIEGEAGDEFLVEDPHVGRLDAILDAVGDRLDEYLAGRAERREALYQSRAHHAVTAVVCLRNSIDPKRTSEV